MSLDSDSLLDRRRLKRRLVVWRVVAIVAVVALVGVILSELFPPGERHVARLNVDGIIVEDRDREEALDKIAKDDTTAALIVRINSPGGTTTGSEELYHALRRVAADKPVVAVLGTVAASGGYIAAIGADHIVARETSLTGSIGVLMQTAEFTGLMEKLGIVPNSLKSKPLKGQPSPLEPLTEDARTAIQTTIDDSYQWFSDLVATRRNLDSAQTAAVADGRIFTGRQARENRLVDAIGGERAARDWLESEHSLPKSLPVIDLQYGEEASLGRRLVMSLAGKVLSSEVLMLDGLLSVWHAQ